jgi:hypothetical protein
VFWFPKLRSFTQTCGFAPGILRSHFLVWPTISCFLKGFRSLGVMWVWLKTMTTPEWMLWYILIWFASLLGLLQCVYIYTYVYIYTPHSPKHMACPLFGPFMGHSPPSQGSQRQPEAAPVGPGPGWSAPEQYLLCEALTYYSYWCLVGNEGMIHNH